MEEEEEEQDTSLKGRLMSLVYMIKGRPQKTEEKPTEQEQAAPSKACQKFILQMFLFLSVSLCPLFCCIWSQRLSPEGQNNPNQAMQTFLKKKYF